jgi:hypothetical protein
MTWSYAPLALWSNIEMSLGILCACFPALAGLCQRLYSAATSRNPSYSPAAAPRDHRKYELRIRSQDLSDGRFSVYGVAGLGGRASRTPAVVKMEAMVSERSVVRDLSPRPKLLMSQEKATEEMISAGYSAFAGFKK